MELTHLKRHLPSVEDGRWVDATEVPELRDVKLKLRGASSSVARAAYAARERMAPTGDRDATGKIKQDVAIRMILECALDDCLVDVSGLTEGGLPMTADRLRQLARLPEYQPLADLVMQALSAVDQTREAQIEAISGN